MSRLTRQWEEQREARFDSAGICHGGVFDCDCACASAPPAPNYQPVADASKESAEIMAALGREQLAEARRQYDQTKYTSDRVANAQVGMMDDLKKQGADYYDYLKTYRPIETAMRDEAAASSVATDAAERQAIVDAGLIKRADIDALNSANATDAATLAAGYGANYEADKASISKMEGMAAADVAQQASIAEQSNARRMAAMGVNPNSGAFAAMGRATAMDRAKMGAGAINQARDAGIMDYRGRTLASRDIRNQDFAQKAGIGQQNMQTLSAGRGMRIQDSATSWAKKLDAAGLVRGLPGASQGAYSAATNAGSSAVANTMAPGAALMNGMAQGSNTIGTGRSMAMNGALGILGAQSSYNNTLANVSMANANMEASGGGDFLGSVASLGMAAGGLGWAPFSDRRLKENIVLVGKDEKTGLNLYEFNYLDNEDARFRGVMADEVESVMPQAVHYDDMGFASVDYDMLGIKMEEV